MGAPMLIVCLGGGGGRMGNGMGSSRCLWEVEVVGECVEEKLNARPYCLYSVCQLHLSNGRDLCPLGSCGKVYGRRRNQPSELAGVLRRERSRHGMQDDSRFML